MPWISFNAPVGLDILGRIISGELELHGIVVRDTIGKKFRFILQGLEHLSSDSLNPNGLSPAEPLLRAIGTPALLQLITIAQNTYIIATLRSIEKRLKNIENTLEDIEEKLKIITSHQKLIQKIFGSAPISRLKAARAAATVALQHRDRTALIAAGKDAQQAAHDLLEQANHLVRLEHEGLPLALLVPTEHADLAESAAEAALVASAIWLTLDNTELAGNIVQEASQTLESMRRKIANALESPELMLRRLNMKEWNDANFLAAGARLKVAMLSTVGRSTLIDIGAMASDLTSFEFKQSHPKGGVYFLPI